MHSYFKKFSNQTNSWSNQNHSLASTCFNNSPCAFLFFKYNVTIDPFSFVELTLLQYSFMLLILTKFASLRLEKESFHQHRWLRGSWRTKFPIDFTQLECRSLCFFNLGNMNNRLSRGIHRSDQLKIERIKGIWVQTFWINNTKIYIIFILHQIKHNMIVKTQNKGRTQNILK